MRTRYFVTDGPLATTVSECSESYFREGLAAGGGGVRILRRDGFVDLVTGSRYLEPNTAIRAEVSEAVLQVVYLGVVIAKYEEWTDYALFTAADYPLGV
ncbi:hypothetical protein [Mycobacterium sp. IS-1556]|uniref:hypothetical protein n=1 Tax=Mycobacterium sp. IS-1556 TaxID=1772276 RepID=UPI0007417025|nr:hypothetical protein [Mycobacterium sp. IS-1556]KUH91838.1 hypothetical protein AU187_04230 [Mycobacterium sp. IS-1556]